MRRSRQLQLARAVAAAMPLAFLGCAGLAGASVGPAWYLVAVAAAVVGPASPDTAGPLLVWGLLALMWVAGGPLGVWWAVPAALAALLGHCATAYLAAAPPGLTTSVGVLLRWAVRLGVLAALTVAVAAGLVAAQAWQLPGSSAWTVVVLLATAAGLYAVRPRPVSED